MNANELADDLDNANGFQYLAQLGLASQAATMLRQQQTEIEALKNANRFIQNFAQEQHQRAVALEMRELTDEEIMELSYLTSDNDPIDFARAILRKAQEK